MMAGSHAAWRKECGWQYACKRMIALAIYSEKRKYRKMSTNISKSFFTKLIDQFVTFAIQALIVFSCPVTVPRKSFMRDYNIAIESVILFAMKYEQPQSRYRSKFHHNYSRDDRRRHQEFNAGYMDDPG